MSADNKTSVEGCWVVFSLRSRAPIVAFGYFACVIFKIGLLTVSSVCKLQALELCEGVR